MTTVMTTMMTQLAQWPHALLFVLIIASTLDHSLSAEGPGSPVPARGRGCRSVLRAPSGGFTSPGYPSAYPANARCRWELQAPHGFVVQLAFSDFQLESQGGCLYDNMTLLDSDGRVLGTFCGITANQLSVNSTGRSLVVLFNSDYTVFERGFSAVYHQVASGMLSQKAVFHNNSISQNATSHSIQKSITQGLTVCVRLLVEPNTELTVPKQMFTVFSYMSTLKNNNKLGMSVLFPSTVHFYLRGTTYILENLTGPQMTGGSWHKLCVTANHSMIQLFLNGSLISALQIQISTINNSQSTTLPVGPSNAPGADATTVPTTMTAVVVKTKHNNNNNNNVGAPGQIKKAQSTARSDPVGNTTVEATSGVAAGPKSGSNGGANGSSVITAGGNTPVPLVLGGGCLSLGRQQNETIVLLEENAFVGELFAFRLWDEVLSDSALRSSDCVWPNNTIVDWKEGDWNTSAGLLVPDGNLPCGEEGGDPRNMSIDDFHPHPPPTTSATTTTRGNCSNNSCIPRPTPYVPTFEEIKLMNITADTVYSVALALLARAQRTGAQFSEEELHITADTLQRALQVGPVEKNLASTMLNVVSNMMEAQDRALAAVSSKTLKTVDMLGLRLNVSGGNASVWAPHLLLAVADPQPPGPPRPLVFGVGPQSEANQELLSNTVSSELRVWVQLPAALLQTHGMERVHFNLYNKTSGLFNTVQESGLVSPVVAATIGNASLVNLRENVTVSLSHSYATGATYKCVFWNFNKAGGPGWSQDGCEVTSSSAEQTNCSCNHLTNFGVLLQLSDVPMSNENSMALTFITYIGCGVSSILLGITLLTHIAFEKLRRDFPSRILMNLCAALLLLNLVFLVDPWLASLAVPGLCVATAALLHYALLAAFTWMGLEALHMYIALVKVFNTYIRRYILKFCLAGWGIPAVVVCLVLAIQRDVYGLVAYSRSTNATQDPFCWFRDNGDAAFYSTVVAFLAIVLCINTAMFVVVLVQICGVRSSRAGTAGANADWRTDILRDLKGSVSLTFLLGLTWVFAFFAWGPANLAFMYLFCILNTLQGAFIFVFHCAMKENVRKHWRRYLCCGRCRLPDNSDWSRTGTNYTKKPGSNEVTKSVSNNSTNSSTNSSHASTGLGNSSQSCLVAPRRKPVSADASSTLYDSGEAVYSSTDDAVSPAGGQNGQPLAHLPRGGGAG